VKWNRLKTMRSIAKLDLSHYTKGTPQEKQTFIKRWGEGLKEYGFVSIINHGVDQQLIRKAYAETEKLFALSTEEKKKFEIKGGGGQRGYTGFGQEHAKNRKVGDLKEFWHVGRDLAANDPKKSTYGNNVWPLQLPEFKRYTLELFASLDVAARVMLQALGEYFELPKDTFADMAHNGNSILRIIHYPPLKDRFIPGGVRAAEHEDINLITLLCESTSTGLELLARDGTWLAVDSLPGQIIVDSGDMLSRITNEVIPSTTHRVVNPKSDADDVVRYSMPFFVHPFPDCWLKILDTCVSAENPKRYPDITADAFLIQRLKEIGLIK
jgi:isopenicillin N synthase-like dioxygenase